MIVVFEGIDGSGKTTLCKSILKELTRQLPKKPLLVHWYSFVGYADEQTKLAFKGVKKLKADHILPPLPNSLWHCADFATRWTMQVLPALKNGHVVLMDRYFYSALVRDCVRGLDESFVRSMYSYVTCPDIVIYLDVDPKIAAARKGDQIAYYEAGEDFLIKKGRTRSQLFVDFQTRCKNMYSEVLPLKTVTIDANQSAATVKKQVLDLIYSHNRKVTKR